MTPIQVIGIGLDGPAGLSTALHQLVLQADVLAGSDRHLSYFPDHPAQRWPLTGIEMQLQAYLQHPHPGLAVILVSGDPFFFGLGRQLLNSLPAATMTFHPHVSSVQLAFSRVKLPWQGAALVSAHGRSLECLGQSLKTGADPIAVLTDTTHTPAAIARLVQSLELPAQYRLWVCENLGGADERVQSVSLAMAQEQVFSPLNVVILQRVSIAPEETNIPLVGIPDQAFFRFPDRPGLMTKREVRVLSVAELALQPQQVIWDIGAGTGSVSIELARLVSDGQVWAIEKTTAGSQLIRQNAERFGTPNVTVVHGPAPEALANLPHPHRVFVGGSQGQLLAILDCCAQRLLPAGRIVIALATIEHVADVSYWLRQFPQWEGRFQQISVSRSTAVGASTRWTPLNPITLVCLTPRQSSPSATHLAGNPVDTDGS